MTLSTARPTLGTGRPSDLTKNRMRPMFLSDTRVAPAIPSRAGEAPKSRKEPSMPEIPREIAYLVTFVLIEAAIIDGRSLLACPTG